MLLADQVDLLRSDVTPFEFAANLPNNLTELNVLCERLINLTPFPANETREFVVDFLLSTDGGINYVSQGGMSFSEAIESSREPTMVNLQLAIPKSPNRKIKIVVIQKQGNLKYKLSANAV